MGLLVRFAAPDPQRQGCGRVTPGSRPSWGQRLCPRQFQPRKANRSSSSTDEVHPSSNRPPEEPQLPQPDTAQAEVTQVEIAHYGVVIPA